MTKAWRTVSQQHVDEPDALMPALERAVSVVKDEGRQAVLNVITAGI